MATEWQRVEIEIPESYSRVEREAIAQEIVDRIRERTQEENLDRNNRPLPKYSKEYTESLDFKNAGKSKSDVNFTQSGDTLAALDLLETEPGKLVIGWEKGSTANAIADGNIRGTYGHASPVGPKRDILGITKSDLKRILNRYPVDAPDELDAQIMEYLFLKGASAKYGK